VTIYQILMRHCVISHHDVNILGRRGFRKCWKTADSIRDLVRRNEAGYERGFRVTILSIGTHAVSE